MKEAYFESISAHLFDYYKAAIWSIIRQASKDDDRSGLQAVVKEISVEYELYKNKVSSIKAAAFEISDLKNLIAAAT